jgi:hypothetical protein
VTDPTNAASSNQTGPQTGPKRTIGCAEYELSRSRTTHSTCVKLSQSRRSRPILIRCPPRRMWPISLLTRFSCQRTRQARRVVGIFPKCAPAGLAPQSLVEDGKRGLLRARRVMHCMAGVGQRLVGNRTTAISGSRILPRLLFRSRRGSLSSD